MTMNLINLAESGSLPDWLIRIGIRRLLSARLRKECRGDVEQQRTAQARFIEELLQSPIAIATDEANRQHYEVPAAFFQQVLGRMFFMACAESFSYHRGQEWFVSHYRFAKR